MVLVQFYNGGNGGRLRAAQPPRYVWRSPTFFVVLVQFYHGGAAPPQPPPPPPYVWRSQTFLVALVQLYHGGPRLCLTEPDVLRCSCSVQYSGPLRTQAPNPESRIPNPNSGPLRTQAPNPESRIPRASRIPNPESRVPNPEFPNPNSGPLRTRAPNPESRIPNPESRAPNPESDSQLAGCVPPNPPASRGQGKSTRKGSAGPHRSRPRRHEELLGEKRWAAQGLPGVGAELVVKGKEVADLGKKGMVSAKGALQQNSRN